MIKIDPAKAAAARLVALRAKRDAALAASDWTQIPDSPLTDVEKAAWAIYRQALRDLPEDGAAWPTAPGAG
ncbi:MAG: phage tail assembly chaperone [Rhodobacteraceae bacterium]|nr:phage tail assembly chaperone [Paracoccaceae bacterium]